MMITSRRYRILQKHYETKDGIQAIGLYVLTIVLMLLYGYICTFDLKESTFQWIQTAFSVVAILIVVLAIKIPKQKLKSIGITKRLRLKSVRWGVTGALLLTCIIMVGKMVSSNGKIGFQTVSIVIAVMFVIGGIAEEMIFRGYIETRLSGIVKNRSLCSCIVGAMFVLFHSPIMFGLVKNTAVILSGFYMMCIYMICFLIMHYFCDYIYRKTNCLYGSMILHVLYNIGAVTLVVV